MVLHPAFISLALLPPVLAHVLRRSPLAVMLAGVGSLGALALATGVFTPPPAPHEPGSHPVEDMDFTGIEIILYLAFAAMFLIAAIAQWIKTRLGATGERALTLAGFWLSYGGLITGLTLPNWEPLFAAIQIALLAGFSLLAFAIILRPLLRSFGRTT